MKTWVKCLIAIGVAIGIAVIIELIFLYDVLNTLP